MRKGKMAAKMASMRRAAELEVEGDEIENKGNPTLQAAQKKVVAGMDGEGGQAESSMPKPRFMSARTPVSGIGAGRGEISIGPSSFGLGRMGYRRSGDPDNIYDQLDKGLEWCQSRCEHAAHQFLRDGECSAEIREIKKRLLEVREGAGKELERLAKEPLAPPSVFGGVRRHMNLPEDGKARQLKSVHLRRDYGPLKELEVDTDMEVDEGVDGMEISPKLVFKRSKDITR